MFIGLNMRISRYDIDLSVETLAKLSAECIVLGIQHSLELRLLAKSVDGIWIQTKIFSQGS